MKLSALILPAGLVVALGLTACQQGGNTANVTSLSSMRDSVSYAIGMNVGSNMLNDSVDYDPAVLLQGLRDAAKDSSERLLAPAGVMSTLMAYQQILSEKRMENMRKAGEAGKVKGDEYRAAYGKKEGVVTLPSGLQYRIIKQGKGPKPTRDQAVVAHYTGTLIDGKKFDSSRDRNEPATFRLTEVIAGWTEALQLMPVGSTWELVIPPDLGYGERGSGPIGPNETLIFEVELLEAKNP
jgi:FKBP-type peptidyl-prolyl cis-trans isomerase FklB